MIPIENLYSVTVGQLNTCILYGLQNDNVPFIQLGML